MGVGWLGGGGGGRGVWMSLSVYPIRFEFIASDVWFVTGAFS